MDTDSKALDFDKALDEALAELQNSSDRPFAAQINTGTLDIGPLTVDQLAAAIGTAAYLGKPTVEWAHEFVWRCGEKREVHERYFGDWRFLGPLELWNELHLAGYRYLEPEYFRLAMFSVRFQYVPLESIIMAGNNRLFNLRMDEKWPVTNDDIINIYRYDRSEMLQKAKLQFNFESIANYDAVACLRALCQASTPCEVLERYGMEKIMRSRALKCLGFAAPAFADYPVARDMLSCVPDREVLAILHTAGWPITSSIYLALDSVFLPSWNGVMDYLIAANILPDLEWIMKQRSSRALDALWKFGRAGCIRINGDAEREWIRKCVVNCSEEELMYTIGVLHEQKIWDAELIVHVKHRVVCRDYVDAFKYLLTCGVTFGRVDVHCIIGMRSITMLSMLEKRIPLNRPEYMWHAVESDWIEGAQYFLGLGVAFDEDMYHMSMLSNDPAVKNLIMQHLKR